MFGISWSVLSDPNTQWILIGCLLLGLMSGIVGSFAYLRKQSLVGDTLAHSALPGICIAFMLTGVKSLPLFFLGAFLSCMLATAGISILTRYTRIKADAAMGIMLSVFFGAGIVLLTHIQHSNYGNQSGLDKFLFGQAASMIQSDVYTMAGVSVLIIAACSLLFKEFKMLSFDPGFARGLGFPVEMLEQLLMLFTVMAVVVGIQAVGVVLVAALLITPAVSARYWTEHLGLMVTLSGVFGAAGGVIGTLASTTTSNLPTGPLSVLAVTFVFLCSVVFAPRRGMLAKWIRRLRNNRSIRENERSRQAQASPRLRKEASL
ncbi:metal ABC transporter permease [Paenibacillus apiarius]|uniref:Metal ABC transporter permease n=1 Tax=Paenibacillus apiarius TaxID=46240 RepID=A0ABT4E0N4_9BACL|nr:metal ABC transporter permease [Paenibacillus apiarius]MCY9512700.1 metal ABC transporter permease [Paenibacillus apiarius]MCY9523040.1 metal ABC transporter permease [Paenibacillus apiarius]MCY9550698.1 metal ABC transporter permease [Paenibacillus apiarius]MCY9556522.1 metal ABC transporter permease [Paenibacillus apiarius]MCY9682941.1 metal ABC transporter permease [Paenibacillus apiarius]